MAQAVRIMPLGDSITRGSHRTGSIPGGYRKELGMRLANSGAGYDFVGYRNDNPAAGIDPDHNGNDGIRTDQVLANIQSWLAVNPDIVLMKLGTNDMIQKVPVSTAANNLRSLIQRITDNAPNRRLYVATIIPINEARDGYTVAQWAPIVNAYNTQVRNLVQEFAGQGRKVVLVDMHAGLTYTDPDPSMNFFQPTDGTHPGPAGYNQMGAFWFNAIRSGLSLPPANNSPNLLANGSFESDFSGWSAGGNQSIQSGYAAPDGKKIVSFNGGNSTPNAVLSQTFATTAGTSYTLTFDAGVMAYNSSQQQLQLSVAGSGTLLSKTVVLTGSGNGTSWFRQTFVFVANSASATLTFRDQSTATQSIDFLLDNVRVTGGGSTGGSNGPPVATADSYSTSGTLAVPAPGVLGNDTDPQANPLTATMDTGAGHGTVSLNANGSFTYAPVSGYTGYDSFTYHANDGSANSNVVTVGISVSAPSAPGVLVNGGFESGLGGWTAAGNVSGASGSPYTSTEGSRLAAFNGGNRAPNGTLSQSFSTTAGQTYTLAFDAGALAYNTDLQTMQVTVNGAGSLLSRTIGITGAGGGNNRWQPQSFSFVADSSSATLTFRDQSVSTNAIDLLLDNVRVNGGGAAAGAMAASDGAASAGAAAKSGDEKDGKSNSNLISANGNLIPGETFTFTVIERQSSVRKLGRLVRHVPVPDGIPAYVVGRKVKFTVGHNGRLIGPGFSIHFVSGNAAGCVYEDANSGANRVSETAIVTKSVRGKPVEVTLVFRKSGVPGLPLASHKVRYVLK